MGGFTGMGTPGSIKSEGRTTMSALPQEDRAKVEALFAAKHPATSNFYYRVTKTGANSSQTINVAADKLPPSLLATIKTSLP